MKGKIANNGQLYIDRGNGYQEMICPTGSMTYCRHSCALFGKPNTSQFGEHNVDLELCKKTLSFTELKDERISNSN